VPSSLPFANVSVCPFFPLTPPAFPPHAYVVSR
jgi:hypothetical protein